MCRLSRKQLIRHVSSPSVHGGGWTNRKNPCPKTYSPALLRLLGKHAEHTTLEMLLEAFEGLPAECGDIYWSTEQPVKTPTTPSGLSGTAGRPAQCGEPRLIAHQEDPPADFRERVTECNSENFCGVWQE